MKTPYRPFIRMTFSLAACWLLVLSQISGSTSNVYAQDSLDPEAEAKTQNDPLTVENLIGTAVSLKKKDYPEIEKAIQRFKNTDVQGALDYLNQAKDKYPKLPPTDITMAKMQLAARNGKAVRLLLERAVVEHPGDPESYLLLADQAFVGGRTTEAQALFELADPYVQKFNENKLRKENFEIRVIAGRSAVAERRQQWEQAKELLGEWLEKDPDSAAAYQRLGVVMFNLDDSKGALNSFKKAREIEPSLGHPFVFMARLFSQKGENKNAKMAFERAYKEDQTDIKVAQAYAEWLIQQDELDDAQEVASTLSKQSPDSIQALLLDGIVNLMRGERKNAEDALAKVLDINPAHPAATNILALLLIESDASKDQKRALQYAEMNAQRFPQSVQANVTYGWVLYNLKQAAKAQAALQKGAQSGNLPANSAYLVARIMSEQEKQKEQAAATLEQVLKQSKGLFLFRREAQQLLDKLKAELNK